MKHRIVCVIRDGKVKEAKKKMGRGVLYREEEIGLSYYEEMRREEEERKERKAEEESPEAG